MCLLQAQQRCIHLQMLRNPGPRQTVCNLFANYSDAVHAMCHALCFCSCRLFLGSGGLRAVSALTADRPSLTSAGLRPFSFTLLAIYALREAKWCIQRHPLGGGQQRVSKNCILLLLFSLSTADLEITRFKIGRQSSSPMCMKTG